MSGQEPISPSSTAQYSYASEEEKRFFEWIQQKTAEYLEEPLLDLRDETASTDSRYKTIITGLFNDQYPMTKENLSSLSNILESEGHLIMFIKLYTALYDETDAGFNYWHKWNKSEIKKKLTAGLEIVKMRYFKVLPAASANENNMFADLVTTFYLDDPLVSLKGLAVIVIAEKRSN